jgi:ParB family chromosome partitioning protein
MSNVLVSIPLSSLRRSKLNVRKTEPLSEIEQLAASIKSKGLLENLVVRPGIGGNQESFEVIAGSRRFAALKLLAKQKHVSRDHPVSCLLLSSCEASDLIEISLAENLVRAPVHPADQFEAFANLQKEGLSVDEIGARFGLATTIVRQRLKLAAVSPKLMAEYRAKAMTLEQLMAYTISDDREAQEEVWRSVANGDPSPRAIRRLLTKSHVEGSDRRAIFIGTKAYEEAGGVIIRDLFSDEDEGYFSDSQLLDRLVQAKLESEAASVKAEGWGWVEIRAENTYVDLSQFGRIRMIETPLSHEEEVRLTALSERYDELIAAIDDDPESTDAARELDEVSAELEALQDKRETWPEAEKKGAGAVISLDYTGCPQVMRGLVRPEDRREAKAVERDEDDDSREDVSNGYSESLPFDLSEHRTAALQECLAARPDIALVALLHALALRMFYEHDSEICVSITPHFVKLRQSAEEHKAISALFGRNRRWRERLPEASELWSWIHTLDEREKLELLAYCTAVTLDVTHRGRREIEDQSDATQITRAVALNMADWWRPTQAGFFDRITKAQIVEGSYNRRLEKSRHG